MIVIVENRSAVADAYAASFGREGVAAAGFCSTDFEYWVAAAAEDDVRAVEAFLIGECSYTEELATILRRRCTAAIIGINEHRSLSDTLEYFAKGVDDVVSKPCHALEILARIEAISRRARTGITNEERVDEIKIFRDGRDPLIRGEPMGLPRRELRILEFLVGSRSRRVTKAQIFNAVYGLFDQEIDDTVIESHISKLRRRLRERLGYDPIESLRHLGYRLECRPRPGDEPAASTQPDPRVVDEPAAVSVPRCEN